MFQSRSNEKTNIRVDQTQRTSRGYEINGQWYFELRGGGQKGPYDNELAMQVELNEFIHLHKLMNQQN